MKKLCLYLIFMCVAAAALVSVSQAATHIVSMTAGNRFLPAVTNILVGDTIIWMNAGVVQHSVTPTNNGEAFCGTALLDRCEWTFTQPGSFAYYCIPHFRPPFQTMTGLVVVASPPNVAPTVTITTPQDGATFGAPATFQITANAQDSDGSVTNVEFFVNGASVGAASPPNFTASVQSLAAGNYLLTAITTDSRLATGTSSPVSITVTQRTAALPRYSLTLLVSPTNAGAVAVEPPQPDGGYESNSVVTLTASAANDFEFSNWSGGVTSTSNRVTLTIDADKTVIGNFVPFVPPRFRLTVNITPPDSGRILITPAADSSGTYSANTVVALAAVPEHGFHFAHWVGATVSTNNPLLLAMNANTELTALFEGITALDFNSFAGAYQGLLLDEQTINHTASGTLSLRLSKSGAYRGVAVLGGMRQLIAGQFDRFGYAPLTMRRGTLTGSLQLESDELRITGTLTDGNKFPSLLLYRAISPTNNSDLAGTYALTLGTNGPVNLEGTAWLTISPNGLARVRGTLADGATFSQRTRITPDTRVPIAAMLYGESGSLIGWFALTTNATIEGTMHWVRPADSRNREFPGGFAIQVPVAGTRQ
ncbi:MAG TPA: Ig-like domain-containing protein [Candidatus Acidoferrum sp.]|nr:Ig-like domain-containing protein [Candidatus Acidoferrum sp.]